MKRNTKEEQELIDKLIEWVELWDSEFAKIHNKGVSLNPSLKFNLKGRSRGGVAWRHKNFIQFSLDWARYNLDVYAETTVPHELAHLYTWAIYGESGHKARWKTVMRSVGLTPNRTNGNFSGVKPARKTRRYEAVMPCGCILTLSKTRSDWAGMYSIHCDARTFQSSCEFKREE